MPSGPISVVVLFADAGKISASSPRRPWGNGRHETQGTGRPLQTVMSRVGRNSESRGALEPACLVRDLSYCGANLGHDGFRSEVASGWWA